MARCLQHEIIGGWGDCDPGGGGIILTLGTAAITRASMTVHIVADAVASSSSSTLGFLRMSAENARAFLTDLRNGRSPSWPRATRTVRCRSNTKSRTRDLSYWSASPASDTPFIAASSTGVSTCILLLTNFFLIWAHRPVTASPGRRSPSACPRVRSWRRSGRGGQGCRPAAQHTSRSVVSDRRHPLLAKLVGTAISPRDQ